MSAAGFYLGKERCGLEPDAYSLHGPPVAVVEGGKAPMRVCEVCATSPMFRWVSVEPLAGSGFTGPMFDAIRAARVACWQVFVIQVDPADMDERRERAAVGAGLDTETRDG